MCLSVPARVLALEQEGSMAVVSMGGVTRRVPLTALELEGQSVEVGDWLQVHTGLAVRVLSQQEAEELLSVGEATVSPPDDDDT